MKLVVQCGEIDIMEYRGQEPTKVLGTVHGPGYSGGASITKAIAC
jgi:beta-glucanase (GH16 family)